MGWSRGAFLYKRNVPCAYQDLQSCEKEPMEGREPDLLPKISRPKTLCTLATCKEAYAKCWKGRERWKDLAEERWRALSQVGVAIALLALRGPYGPDQEKLQHLGLRPLNFSANLSNSFSSLRWVGCDEGGSYEHSLTSLSLYHYYSVLS